MASVYVGVTAGHGVDPGQGTIDGPADLSGGQKLVGFNEDPDPSRYSLQASLGMPVRRISVPWNGLQPAPDSWDWSQYDAQYSALLTAGLRPLIVAVAAPCWAHPAVACTPATQAPPDPQFDSAWAQYIGAVARRYPGAIGIEIWNEPNLNALFSPRADPARYAQLLQIAYEAVKNANPNMPVVSGGLFASSEGGPNGMADAEFLSGMYAAGANGFMDAIGAHPYPTTEAEGAFTGRYDPSAMERDLERLRRVRDLMGDASIPIWVTEAGVSTQSAPGAPTAASEDEQSAYLTSMVESGEHDSDVPVFLIHRLIDEPHDPSEGPLDLVEAGFGVFRSDGTPKPAACSLSEMFAGSLAC